MKLFSVHVTGVSSSPTGAVMETGQPFCSLRSVNCAGCVVSLKFTPINCVSVPLGGIDARNDEKRNRRFVICRAISMIFTT